MVWYEVKVSFPLSVKVQFAAEGVCVLVANGLNHRLEESPLGLQHYSVQSGHLSAFTRLRNPQYTIKNQSLLVRCKNL